MKLNLKKIEKLLENYNTTDIQSLFNDNLLSEFSGQLNTNTQDECRQSAIDVFNSKFNSNPNKINHLLNVLKQSFKDEFGEDANYIDNQITLGNYKNDESKFWLSLNRTDIYEKIEDYFDQRENSKLKYLLFEYDLNALNPEPEMFIHRIYATIKEEPLPPLIFDPIRITPKIKEEALREKWKKLFENEKFIALANEETPEYKFKNLKEPLIFRQGIERFSIKKFQTYINFWENCEPFGDRIFVFLYRHGQISYEDIKVLSEEALVVTKNDYTEVDDFDLECFYDKYDCYKREYICNCGTLPYRNAVEKLVYKGT